MVDLEAQKTTWWSGKITINPLPVKESPDYLELVEVKPAPGRGGTIVRHHIRSCQLHGIHQAHSQQLKTPLLKPLTFYKGIFTLKISSIFFL